MIDNIWLPAYASPYMVNHTDHIWLINVLDYIAEAFFLFDIQQCVISSMYHSEYFIDCILEASSPTYIIDHI